MFAVCVCAAVQVEFLADGLQQENVVGGLGVGLGVLHYQHRYYR